MSAGLVPLARLEVAVGPPVAVGATPGGEVRFVPIVGGTFTGADDDDGFRGRVLAGGADWQEVRAGGLLEISARYLLETDAGEVVEVRSDGIRHAAPEVAERLARGDDVDPGEYYFRTAIRLRTAAPALERLNRLLAVAVGERRAAVVHLAVSEVA